LGPTSRPALRLARMEQDLGEERMAGPDGALVRGGHWRNFWESTPNPTGCTENAGLSALCRRKPIPPLLRRAIAGPSATMPTGMESLAACICLTSEADLAYLAIAEQELRHDEELSWEVLDFDGDGHQEIWIHSNQFSAVVIRRRRGWRYTCLPGPQFCRALTRRREAYHDRLSGRRNWPPATGSAAKVFTISRGHPAGIPLPHSTPRSALFGERIVSGSMSLEEYARGDYHPLSLGRAALAVYRLTCRRSGGS